MKCLGGNERDRCSRSSMRVCTRLGQNVVMTVHHMATECGRVGWSVRAKGVGDSVAPPPCLSCRGQSLTRGAAVCPLEGRSKGEKLQIVLWLGVRLDNRKILRHLCLGDVSELNSFPFASTTKSCFLESINVLG